MPFSFILPSLPPKSLSKLPEEKREFSSSQEHSASAELPPDPITFEIFKNSIEAQELNPLVKAFLNSILSITEDSLEQEQALRAKYKLVFEDSINVKALLNAILRARNDAIIAIYEHRPLDEMSEVAYMIEMQKRLKFMSRVEVILRTYLYCAKDCEAERTEFLKAFFEDIRLNLKNISEGAKDRFALYYGKLAPCFEQDQRILDTVFVGIKARIQEHIPENERAELLSILGWTMKAYKYKAIFKFAAGEDVDADHCLDMLKNHYLLMKYVLGVIDGRDSTNMVEQYEKFYDAIQANYQTLKLQNENDKKRKCYVQLLSGAQIFSTLSRKVSSSFKDIDAEVAKEIKRLNKVEAVNDDSVKLLLHSMMLLNLLAIRNYDSSLPLFNQARVLGDKVHALFSKDKGSLIVTKILLTLEDHFEMMDDRENTLKELLKNPSSRVQSAVILDDTLQAKLKTAQTEREAAQRKLGELRALMKTENAAKKALEAELQALKAQMLAAPIEAEGLSQASIQREQEEITNKLKIAETAFAKLQENVSELTKRLELSEKQIPELTDKLEQSKAAIIDSKSLLTESEMEAQGLQDSLSTSKSENQKLQDSLKASESEIEKLRALLAQSQSIAQQYHNLAIQLGAQLHQAQFQTQFRQHVALPRAAWLSPFFQFQQDIGAVLGTEPRRVSEYLSFFVNGNQNFDSRDYPIVYQAIPHCLKARLKEYFDLLDVVAKYSHPILAFQKLYGASFIQNFVPLTWPQPEERVMDSWSKFVESELSACAGLELDRYGFLNLLLLGPDQALKIQYPAMSAKERAENLSEDLVAQMTGLNTADQNLLKARIQIGLPIMIARFEEALRQSEPELKTPPKAVVFSKPKAARRFTFEESHIEPVQSVDPTEPVPTAAVPSQAHSVRVWPPKRGEH